MHGEINHLECARKKPTHSKCYISIWIIFIPAFQVYHLEYDPRNIQF